MFDCNRSKVFSDIQHLIAAPAAPGFGSRLDLLPAYFGKFVAYGDIVARGIPPAAATSSDLKICVRMLAS